MFKPTPIPFRLSPSIRFEEKGGDKVDPTPPADKTETVDIDAIREQARKEERERIAAERQKEDERRQQEEAERKGEWETVAKKAEERAKSSDERAAAAERRAQLAEVNIALRDHLQATHADYLSNATDIMLHVTAKLAPDAKPEDVRKLIADEAKAFVERTPRATKGGTTPAPGQRIPRGADVPPRENEAMSKRRPFAHLHTY